MVSRYQKCGSDSFPDGIDILKVPRVEVEKLF
jgi:hypothetical protein